MLLKAYVRGYLREEVELEHVPRTAEGHALDVLRAQPPLQLLGHHLGCGLGLAVGIVVWGLGVWVWVWVGVRVRLEVRVRVRVIRVRLRPSPALGRLLPTCPTRGARSTAAGRWPRPM